MDSNKEAALTTAEGDKQDVVNHDTARNEEDDDLSRRVLKVVCRINELIWAQRCKEMPEEFVQHMESVSSATVRAFLKEMLTTLRFDLPADVSQSILASFSFLVDLINCLDS